MINRFTSLLAIAAFTLVAVGCGSNSTGIDFSTVPAPYDTTAAVNKLTPSGGPTIYVIDQGNGVFTLNENDFASFHFTARTADGEVFDSSYLNGSEIPRNFANLSPVNQISSDGNRSIPPLLEGLRLGVLGMVEGEKRTVVVPPELSFEENNVNRGRVGGLNMNGFDLKGKKLVIDVKLVNIL